MSRISTGWLLCVALHCDAMRCAAMWCGVVAVLVLPSVVVLATTISAGLRMLRPRSRISVAILVSSNQQSRKRRKGSLENRAGTRGIDTSRGEPGQAPCPLSSAGRSKGVRHRPIVAADWSSRRPASLILPCSLSIPEEEGNAMMLLWTNLVGGCLCHGYRSGVSRPNQYRRV